MFFTIYTHFHKSLLHLSHFTVFSLSGKDEQLVYDYSTYNAVRTRQQASEANKAFEIEFE